MENHFQNVVLRRGTSLSLAIIFYVYTEMYDFIACAFSYEADSGQIGFGICSGPVLLMLKKRKEKKKTHTYTK